jgi:hypothetical protein
MSLRVPSPLPIGMLDPIPRRVPFANDRSANLAIEQLATGFLYRFQRVIVGKDPSYTFAGRINSQIYIASFGVDLCSLFITEENLCDKFVSIGRTRDRDVHAAGRETMTESHYFPISGRRGICPSCRTPRPLFCGVSLRHPARQKKPQRFCRAHLTAPHQVSRFPPRASGPTPLTIHVSHVMH